MFNNSRINIYWMLIYIFICLFSRRLGPMNVYELSGLKRKEFWRRKIKKKIWNQQCAVRGLALCDNVMSRNHIFFFGLVFMDPRADKRNWQIREQIKWIKYFFFKKEWNCYVLINWSVSDPHHPVTIYPLILLLIHAISQIMRSTHTQNQ